MTQRNKSKAPRYYTTKKPASQWIAEIMQLLGEYGADSYHVQQTGGTPTAIAFVFRGVPYQMRPSIHGMQQRLDATDAAKKSRHAINAVDVAWAQIRYIIELLLEAVENKAITPEQAFGGLALTSGGRTVADMIEERGGELMAGESLLLPGGDD